ncbi:MAG: DUF349 domain-containing protein [Chitinophagales bacterium]|nr:DUF349 domain-containing protein [Chitinophagaceae bacterium]MCB9064030.1 DUF349 domain-containing protein [Chitinophagales bacterium]
MNQDSNQSPDLGTWWEQQDFAGKDLFELANGTDVLLKAIGDRKERTMGSFSAESPDTLFNLLTEKFTEIKGKVDELETEYKAEEDKLKLLGKLERTKEYIYHANALGDFNALYEPLAAMEGEMQKFIEENFLKKKTIVEKAEALAGSEDWKAATEDLKNVTEEWKAIGHIEKERNDELWSRIEAARDKFFERKREHNEDYNKELLQNLDLKMEVVDQAEKLAASDNWKETTEAFKELMERWKGIGHTMHDKNEELWNRFIAAKNTFFDKKKEHFDVIQKEQEENYVAKEALVAKAVEYQGREDWKEATDDYSTLMDEWKKIGRVPRDKSDDIWKKFNEARDHFFNRKREHFESFKVELEDNYAKKLALLKRAEDLQGSTQWRETTAEINELMDEWKKIGPVPRKHSDEIWKRFIGARKEFFNRKDASRERRKKAYESRSKERVKQTHDFVDKLEAEIREEEEKLADFQEAINNITPGDKKEHELREHLTKLIGQTEKKLEHKKEKLDEVTKQLGTLETKEAEKTEEQKESE